jgi:hypothetical protein
MKNVEYKMPIPTSNPSQSSQRRDLVYKRGDSTPSPQRLTAECGIIRWWVGMLELSWYVVSDK